MSPPPILPTSSPPAEGSAFGRHLFDYPPAAARLWWLIAAAGAAALGWSLVSLWLQPPPSLGLLLTGLAVVGAAALFSVRVPRTHFTVTVTDIFNFGLLALLGPPAAILAAGIEGLLAVLRTSKRLSSHVSGPTAAMAAMAVGAALFTAMRDGLVAAGMTAPLAALCALCLAAPVPIMLSTGSLMYMLAVKRGERLSLREWWASVTWLVALALGQAMVAGLVHVNAAAHGPAVLATATVMMFALVLLVRSTLSRREAEQAAQDALVATAQREARLSHQRFMAAFTHAAIGMAIVCPGGTVLQVNAALCRLLGRGDSDIVGTAFQGLLQAGDADLFQRQADSAAPGAAQPFSMEVRCSAPDGSDIWVALHCSRYDDPGGNGPWPRS